MRIRWLTEDDVPALFAIFSDPHVTKYWSSPPLRDPGEARELLDHIHQSFVAATLFQWGITRREDDRVVGTCTLASITREHRRAEIGFALERAAWGHGLATEAAAAVLRHAFDDLDLHRIEADVDPGNERSVRLLERLGFRREGYARQRYIIEGTLYDSILLGLLREEFIPPDRA